MPKLIPDIQNKILVLGKEILLNEGYLSLSMRTIASKCGIAVGTIYNYYASKDLLVAHIMLEDWNQALTEIKARLIQVSSTMEGIQEIYKGIERFTAIYRSVWMDVPSSQSMITPDRHRILMKQIIPILDELLMIHSDDHALSISWFIAETILRYGSSSEFEYEQLEPILKKLL